jgi:hypothetical protein
MVFAKHLRDEIRRGRIRCSVRIWTRPHVKAGGRYRMEEGQIVVDSIAPMRLEAITDALARESGFANVKDLLETAKHGAGDNVYLIRFHYLPPGGWDVQPAARDKTEARTESGARSSAPSRSQLLRRIRQSAPPRRSAKPKPA